MKVTIVETGEEVTLNWVGFDLVWIIYDDGRQELVHPRVVGMKPRERPNRPQQPHKNKQWFYKI